MQEISEEEFHRAMAGIKEIRETIGRFENREECLSYLSKALGCPARNAERPTICT